MRQLGSGKGGRYDWISNSTENADFGVFTPGETRLTEGAFSPRIGLVYQPSDTVSLYASYSRSFAPVSGRDSEGEPFIPTRGTQYEVGIRTDFLDGRLTANLAAYHLNKTNIVTTEDFIFEAGPQQIVSQIGEQRSQGIELDVTGEILPGWNIVIAYAYTDAQVSEDNEVSEGNRLNGIPKNQASLWTTYTIQSGDLRGLGFGLGLFYVGNRFGDIANTFELGDYLRTDAALYFRRDRLNAAINIRNLFDIDYSSFGYARTFTDRGDPFTIVGSVSWEF